MNEFRSLGNHKSFKSNALKEIPEDDEHLPINIEIEKRQSTKVEPKKSLYRSNFVLQDDSGPQTPFPL